MPKLAKYVTIQPLKCCGIRELSGIISAGTKGPDNTIFDYCQSVADAARDFIFNHYTPLKPSCDCGYCYEYLTSGEKTLFLRKIGCGFLLFTGVDEYGTHGAVLQNYINEQKLGEAREMWDGFNPNSTNNIRIYLWKLDREAIYAWYLQKIKERYAVNSYSEIP